MHRRRYILLFAAFAACSTPSKRLDEVLPERAANWHRRSLDPLNEIPPMIAQAGVEESVSAVYSAAGPIRVRAFRMPTETSAFELIQKWPQADGMAVYKGPYFIVAEAGSDPAAARSLLQTLQAAIL
jgi:hypothetical protein